MKTNSSKLFTLLHRGDEPSVILTENKVSFRILICSDVSLKHFCCALKCLQLDMKYLSPLLLAYEDQLTERDQLLKSSEVSVCTFVFLFS